MEARIHLRERAFSDSAAVAVLSCTGEEGDLRQDVRGFGQDFEGHGDSEER